ncbi:Sugar (pentulose or hexulose) kinase [Microbacterium azadirachtae]|uniref:Sugar (Pentulose or hexulose) kinase n=1 Tax=Microbacterium azadirachtae TaxID=582680 RepID=A0A1I6J3A9_9MICO|nr:FGGY-family carbohydrate kinase [Microbacterium azadirachtae]SFR73419.1 Sugar (pentulose or hexulose) kinase [Microbacterium azadirachtae]
MDSFLVAIDNGSQSTKVLVVDQGGRVHASARVGLRPYDTSRPGHAVHPDDDVWESIATACATALKRFSGDRSRIVGVGLCTIRFCRAYLREDGALAEPVLSWMDERVGRPFDVHADDAQDVRWITSSSGYVSHQLTGERTDASGNLQGMWPIDHRTWRWSADPSDYASTGMPREMLFELRGPGEELGRVTAAASARTGLPEGTPVFATSNDKAVEALGAGAGDEGTVLLSLGTYIAAMTAGAGPAQGTAFWSNFAARPAAYLAESRGVRRGMWTVSWLRQLVQSEGPADETMYDLEAVLDAEAAAVPAGCDGVAAVLDWLAPGDEPWRRGALIGFSGAQGRAHVYRAILEAIALTMRDNVDAMADELGRAPRRLVVTGGGARSETLRRILADSFDVPVHRAGLDDAAGLGAAVCAAVGAGVHPDWDAAVGAMVRRGAETRPGAGVATYQALRLWHRGVRQRVAELSRWAVENGLDPVHRPDPVG